MGNRNNNKIYIPCLVNRAVVCTRTKCSPESCSGERHNALLKLILGESQLISEFSRLQQPEALWLKPGKLEDYSSPHQVQREAVKRKESEQSKYRDILEKGEKTNCILTVLFRTSILGNFLLIYLRDDSMDFSSKKGGLDLGSEQV